MRLSIARSVVRGAGAGERVFAPIGIGAGIVGILAAHGAPTALTGALTGVGFIGAGLLLVATAATALVLLVLEGRYLRVLAPGESRAMLGHT